MVIQQPMTFVQRLLCGNDRENKRGDAQASHSLGKPVVATTEGPLYTHITTLFRDNKELFSFINRFRHAQIYPPDSLKHIFVLEQKVASFHRLEYLLHRELPISYQVSIPQRGSQYDPQKAIHAHLTTVFEEDRALFSCFLEFQLEHKHSTGYNRYKFPRPEWVIHLRRLPPYYTTLPASNSSNIHRSRTESVPQDGASKLMNWLRSDSVQRRRHADPHDARSVQAPPLSRSLSAAAAKTAMYGSSDPRKPITQRLLAIKAPTESISFLGSSTRSRRNAQPSNIPEQSEGAEPKTVKPSIPRKACK